MSNIISGIPNEFFKSIAAQLWKSRGEKAWWTPEEGGTYGQILSPANWAEESNSANRFCGSYCQWMLHAKSRWDLRGMTPEQIKQVFVYFSAKVENSKLPPTIPKNGRHVSVSSR